MNFWLTLLLMLGTVTPAVSADPPCPQLDPKKVDPDGVMLCPEAVQEGSVWSVYRCAITQAKSFHIPTKDEIFYMNKLLEGWRSEDSAEMKRSAEALNLQMCRVHLTKKNDVKDSYLLFYVKPKVLDYSGPFMQLRERKYSKVLVIGPHDDSDATFADTKLATSMNWTMGTISNGHRRGNVRKGKPPGYRNDDFVHSDGPSANLGTWVVKKICDMKPKSVVLHVHGMANPKNVMRRSRSPEFIKAFEKAVMKHTNIREFVNLNAYFSIDPLVNTNYYLKTEIPVRIHNNNKLALANIVAELEEYDWAKNQ